MQNEGLPVQQNNEQVLSDRTQRLLNSLGELWQRPLETSSEALKRTTESVLHLPEPFRQTAMTKIAEHLVVLMGLHYLDIMTAFQQKAEQEGIDEEEREATFHDIRDNLFPQIMELSRYVHIRSFDDLVTLSNITIGLYKLSKADSAERAQRWMYRLPKLYYNQLTQEHLIANRQAELTVEIHSEALPPGTRQPQFMLAIQPSFTQMAAGKVHLRITINSVEAPIIDTTATAPGSITTHTIESTNPDASAALVA